MLTEVDEKACLGVMIRVGPCRKACTGRACDATFNCCNVSGKSATMKGVH